MNAIRKQLLAIFAGDEPDYLQAASLGPAALPVLRQMMDADVDTASSAVYVAGLIAASGSLEILERGAQSHSPTLRVRTAGAFREFLERARSADDLDQAGEIIATLLDDDDPDVRRFAQRAAEALPAEVHHHTAFPAR
ncbi:MAG: hypothetical protein JO306_03950 [Gemmatimonadetes bacterium]|nr:hypothetical protein [Gemmatimonadota bacterium]